MTWPTVIYNEEVIREGFGIEDVGIPVAGPGRAARCPLRHRPEAAHRRRLRQSPLRAPDGVLRGAAAGVPSRGGRHVSPLHPQREGPEARPAIFPAADGRRRAVHAVSRRLRRSPAQERQPLHRADHGVLAGGHPAGRSAGASAKAGSASPPRGGRTSWGSSPSAIASHSSSGSTS